MGRREADDGRFVWVMEKSATAEKVVPGRLFTQGIG
jgi:hypothetical protein